MKQVIETISDSIQAEVSAASGWTIQLYNPVWRDPAEGPTLYIYGTRISPGDFRTTGSREDVYEVILEYVERAQQDGTLVRDEAAELAVLDVATSLRQWADNNQTLTDIHRLDYVDIALPPSVRREHFVRHFIITLRARKTATYG